MRYLGPPFYENWSPQRDMNDDGTCASDQVNYATQFSDRNVRYWYLGGSTTLRHVPPGSDVVGMNSGQIESSRDEVHDVCYKDSL